MKKNLAALLTILCLLVLPALSQEFRSTISGHVFDASGGAVPNAKIQVTIQGTNEVTTATSDSSGAYAIPDGVLFAVKSYQQDTGIDPLLELREACDSLKKPKPTGLKFPRFSFSAGCAQ